jgi:hypothetical protein
MVAQRFENRLLGHLITNTRMQICMKKTLALLLTLLSLMLLPASLSVDAKPAKGSGAAARSAKAETAKRAKLAANPLYKEAMELFAKKNFAGARDCFLKLDSTGFCCDTVHYYIGQCYQRTNQTRAAQQHYDWVLSRSKDPTLRAYADYGNQTMAYYNARRTYAGQGNFFAGTTAGGSRAGSSAGGGCGPSQGFS